MTWYGVNHAPGIWKTKNADSNMAAGIRIRGCFFCFQNYEGVFQDALPYIISVKGNICGKQETSQMMAKAHIAVGMAAAFSIMGPGSLSEALPVVTGAALGCLACDLDCENTTERSESSRYRAIMAAVAVAALIEDHLIGAGMWASAGSGEQYLWFTGLAAFVLVCTFASVASHRGFAHSLLALALETAALWLVFPAVAEPFAIAFISHLVLDLMNKKPVRLFYPAEKGFCLKWFYADRLANRVFAAAGSVWLIGAILIGLKG